MRLKSLRTKIALWAGICLIITSAIIVIYSANAMIARAKTARENAIKHAKEYAGTLSREYANHIRAELEVALDTARTLAYAMSGKKNKQVRLEIGRDEVNGILKTVLYQNKNFVGIFTCWEPDAFDQMDIGYKNEAGHDETGRFIPYWYRDNKENILLRPLVSYENEVAGDYYLIPKNTKKECLIEPYISYDMENPLLITSLIVPIIADNIFCGVVGANLRLDIFQDIADNVKSFYDGSAQLLIISNKGIIITASGKPELSGKFMKEIHKNSESDILLIQKSETVVKEDEGRIAIFTPLIPGETVTPWSVNVLVPLEKITFQADQQMKNAIHGVREMIVISSVCITAAFGIIWWLIAGRIASPIRNTSYMIKDIAEGDLTIRVFVKSDDELGDLAMGLNTLLENFRNIIKDIVINVKKLNSSAEILSDTSAKMTAGTEDISSRSNSVALTTEDMAINISMIASTTEEMSVNIQNISSTAEQMAQNVNAVASAIEEMSMAINGIAENTRDGANISVKATEMANTATTVMTTLGGAAKEIGEVTEAIKQIAEQTNLLSLNATIEAASAGDAGRGFSVVANEIKELAKQSGRAAENIADRIEGIQKNTEDAVKVINNVAGIIKNISESSLVITKAVDKQRITANDISVNARQLNIGARNIAASIAEVAKGSNDMSRNAGEAAKAAKTVASNIQSVSHETVNTNTGIKQVNGSVGELREVTEELQKMVGKFKVD